jgi:serine/threonine-protein kinase
MYRRRGAKLIQAVAYLEQAIRKDPSFSRAHAALASALITQPYYLPVHVGAVTPRARVAAERAVSLDPQLADGHIALGMVYYHTYDFAPSESELRQAIALDPGSAEAQFRLGSMLLGTGRIAEAIPPLEKAKAIDPLYPVMAAYLGYAYVLTGKTAQGLAEARRAFELDSTQVASQTRLSYTYSVAGRTADAVEIARRLGSESDDPRRLGVTAYTLGRFGRPGETRPLVAKLEALPLDAPRRNAGLVYAYLGVGDTAHALSAMERAASGDGDLIFLFAPTDHTFDEVRQSPRFAAILKRLKFDIAVATRPNPYRPR